MTKANAPSLQQLEADVQMRASSLWWRKLLASFATHAALIVGMLVFLFPFLWMVSTSFKTDEELPETRLFPSVPRFQDHSPYVKPVPEPTKPIDVDDDDWNRQLPKLLERTSKVVTDAQATGAAHPLDQTVDLDQLKSVAARDLLDSVSAKLNRTLWTGDSVAFDKAFDDLLTPDAAKLALDDSIARFELANVQLRTLDTQIVTLTPGDQMSKAFRVVSGPAKIVACANGALVRYKFDAGSSEPVVIEYTFNIPPGVSLSTLHKLLLATRADNSWHRIEATLDMAGQHFVSKRTMYLAQHRPMSLIFQPPTFDDETARQKTWVPIRAEGQSTDTSLAPNQAKLRLILSPSNTVRANIGKSERNYQRAFYAVPFWKYVGNSVLLVGLTTLGALFSASFVAYAFARLHWPGRSVAFLLLLATMMLPSQVTMIPSFMIWRALGWYNTLNPMWVPSWFGTAFFVFLMVQHMRTIPRELEEAARIDGLNALQSWYYIILPQVKPTLAAIAILSFMGAWNEFMGPLIYLRDQSKFPLSLGLFGMRVDATTGADWTMMMAGNVLMTLPVIVIFFIFQRYFIQGMTVTGMKG